MPTIIKLVPFSNVCDDDGGFAQMSGRALGLRVQAVRAVPSTGERSDMSDVATSSESFWLTFWSS